MAQVKKLYKNKKDAKVAGVCAGIADYFGIDETLARLATIILVFWGGLGIVLYLSGWVLIPVQPDED